jgi:hypothetical protein
MPFIVHQVALQGASSHLGQRGHLLVWPLLPLLEVVFV